MPVDAIGAALGTSDALASQRTSLNQDDFVKLFLAQLTFQDPLEPVDNREFLAQMAQFAGLEQARVTNESVEDLVFMNSTAQSIGLLGRPVEVTGQQTPFVGNVTAIRFSANGPTLTVTGSGSSVLTDVRLSQIRLVKF